VKQRKGFNPTFENGGFWEYYKDLERQFEDFLEYVPYLEGNEETYSFRLANLILSIGAHIDSALKEIAKYSDFPSKYLEMLNPTTKKGKPRKPSIKDYYPISEEYKLTEEVVTFKCLPDREQLKPFLLYQRKTGETCPDWWNAYNKVKHNFNENFKEAKLKTVRDALAGAFLLNVIHEPSADRLFKYGLLKEKYKPKGFGQIHDKFRGKEIQPTCCSPPDTKDQFVIETALFLYDYEKPINLKSP
jgi:hypothetical protein